MPKGKYPRETRFPNKVCVGLPDSTYSKLVSAANSEKVPLGSLARRLLEKPLSDLIEAQRKRRGKRTGDSSETPAR